MATPSNDICPECRGIGFTTPDVEPDNPRFGTLVPCSACGSRQVFQTQEAVPSAEDTGECPIHHMRWKRLRKGGKGHTLTVPQRWPDGDRMAPPLWCIEGHELTEQEYQKWLDKWWVEQEYSLNEHRAAGLVWCHEHRLWEDAADPYDFPLSLSWRRYYQARGLMPGYPEVGPTAEDEREQRLNDRLAEVRPPCDERWWAEHSATTPMPEIPKPALARQLPPPRAGQPRPEPKSKAMSPRKESKGRTVGIPTIET